MRADPGGEAQGGRAGDPVGGQLRQRGTRVRAPRPRRGGRLPRGRELARVREQARGGDKP